MCCTLIACILQADESKHKRKIGRCELGPGEQDLKQWLLCIDQLKPYADQFEEANVTGETMLAIMSESDLAGCGVLIDVEVDKYCLLLNLARVRSHTHSAGQPCTDSNQLEHIVPNCGKATKRLAERDSAALSSIEMEQIVQQERGQSTSAHRPVLLGVC